MLRKRVGLLVRAPQLHIESQTGGRRADGLYSDFTMGQG